MALLFAGSSAQADPTGIIYDAGLDAEVTGFDADGVFTSTLEGHLGEVVFDGLPELIPNDIDPSIEFPGGTFVPGNEIIVTEDVDFNPDGSETITIWYEGQDPAGPFPTPGAPLFTQPTII